MRLSFFHTLVRKKKDAKHVHIGSFWKGSKIPLSWSNENKRNSAARLHSELEKAKKVPVQSRKEQKELLEKGAASGS